jgi:hypothetical protein
MAQATAGAPALRRQSVQWQIEWRLGAALAR